MKNQPGTMKNHENRLGTMENRPGTINKQKRYKQTHRSFLLYIDHQLDPDRIVGLKKVWKDSFWGCLDFSIRTLGAQPGLEISTLVQLLLLRNVEKRCSLSSRNQY